MSLGPTQVDNELLTAATIHVRDDALDLNYKKTPGLAAMEEVHGKGQPFVDGGHTEVIPYLIDDHSPDPTEEITGYEQDNLTVKGTAHSASVITFSTRFTVLCAIREKDLTGGKTRIVNLAERRLKLVMGQAMRAFEKQFFQGGQVGFSRMRHLNGTDDTSNGVIEEDASGSQSNSYFDFSKTTFAGFPGAQNQAFNGLGSANANLWNGFARILTLMENRVEDPGTLRGFLSRNCYEFLHRIIRPQMQWGVGGKGPDDSLEVLPGYRKMLVQGIPVASSEFMPNAGTNTTSLPWSALILPMDDIHFQWLKTEDTDGCFGMGEWSNLGNGYRVRHCNVHLAGQTIVRRWSGAGLIYNAEAW